VDPILGGGEEGAFAVSAERFGAVFCESLGAGRAEEAEDLVVYFAFLGCDCG